VLGVQMVDDFEDVNGDEKALMKLWNRHVRNYPVVPDRLVPTLCAAFVERHGAQVRARGLRHNMALHLAALQQWGLVSGEDVRACLHALDNATYAHGNAVE
jgi:hypothetical protein